MACTPAAAAEGARAAVARPAAAASSRAAAFVPGSVIASAFLLLLAAPTPAQAVRTLSDLEPAADPTAPLAALASLLAWALAGWLLLGLALTLAAHLPGLLGGRAGALACRITPATIRHCLELLLGMSVAVGPLGQLPAAAAGPAGPVPPAVPEVNLDWPSPSAPLQVEPAQAVPAPQLRSSQTDTVLVHPGDSLWEIAGRRLRQHGHPAGDAAVARAWPTWWSANRQVIGDDPHLIRPGLRLRPPTAGHTPDR